jgi:3-hydroxyacyl-[acyl-carrier-protein] dehydratase
MRWIWIDRLLDLQHGKSARATKQWSLAEDVFTEHFPGHPVVPATLILEGLAQTGGILVGAVHEFREKVVLAKINQAVFHRDTFPGEVLTYETEVLTLREEGALIAGRVLVQDETVAEAEIFFAYLDQSRSGQYFGDNNFVFTGELRWLLQRYMPQKDK